MAALPNPDFEKNVFINCPYDKDYTRLLHPLLFTVLYLEFNPRIASELNDSGELRMTKICELIELSKYSIHDLSRNKSKKKKESYRLNMPFELGIDYGCRKFAAQQEDKKYLEGKRFLVVGNDRRSLADAFSDFNGMDPQTHDDQPVNMMRIVNFWLSGFKGKIEAPTKKIWGKFNLFMQNFAEERMAEGFTDDDIYEMPTVFFIGYIKEWLEKNANGNKR